MISCPKCGHATLDSRAGFCDQCGHNLNKGEIDDNFVNSGAFSRSARSEIDANGHPTAHHGGCPEPDNSTTNPEIPVALYINTSQLYMQGSSGIVDIIMVNLSDRAVDSIAIELSGRLIRSSGHSFDVGIVSSVLKRLPRKLAANRLVVGFFELLSLLLKSHSSGNPFSKGPSPKFALAPHSSKRQLIEIEEPRTPGSKLIHFQIVVRQGDVEHRYRAKATVFVMPETKDAENININVGQSGDQVNNFNAAGTINVVMGDQVKRGWVKTTDDRMEKCRERGESDPVFKELGLEPDTQSGSYWRFWAAAALALIAFALSMGIWPDKAPQSGANVDSLKARQEMPAAQVPGIFNEPESRPKASEANRQFGHVQGNAESTKNNSSTTIVSEQRQGEVTKPKRPPIIRKQGIVIEPEETTGEVNEPDKNDLIRRKGTVIQPEETKGEVNEPVKKDLIRRREG